MDSQVLNEALVSNEDGNMQLNIAVLNLAEFFVNSFALSFLFYIEFLHSICIGPFFEFATVEIASIMNSY